MSARIVCRSPYETVIRTPFYILPSHQNYLKLHNEFALLLLLSEQSLVDVALQSTLQINFREELRPSLKIRGLGKCVLRSRIVRQTGCLSRVTSQCIQQGLLETSWKLSFPRISVMKPERKGG
jgi:hypothetical protein